MTSYKVNFKRFVKTVLEKDLVEISEYDDFYAASLAPFTSQTSLALFLQNKEKHFRMQFVIELVSALINCMKKSLTSHSHSSSKKKIEY